MQNLYTLLEDGMLMKTLLCFAFAKMVPLNNHRFRKKVILDALSCCNSHICISPLKNLISNNVVGLSHTPQLRMGGRFFQMIKEL